MTKERFVFYAMLFCVAFVGAFVWRSIRESTFCEVPCVGSIDQVVTLFPKTVNAINMRTSQLMACVTKKINTLCSLPKDERTYENTVREYDSAIASVRVWSALLASVAYTSPHKLLQDAAHAASIRMQAWGLEAWADNIAVYHALKDYYGDRYQSEKSNLSEEERYILDETMRTFEKKGFHLPEKERSLIKEMKKELGQVSIAFAKNISRDKSTITVDRDGLAGVDPDFITSLSQADDGKYVLGVDYPTYVAVMDHCTVEKTRKALWGIFVKRGYPENIELLKKMIALQDRIAKKLGFKSYSHLSLSSTMAGSPEQVEKFLKEILKDVEPKVQEEVAFVKKHLPEGISLNKNNALDPWNRRYVDNFIREKEFSIDDRKVSEYFPVKETVTKVLGLYQDFLNVQFELVSSAGLWADDVVCFKVIDSCQNVLGHLLFDPFPRQDKYTHACHINLVPAHKDAQGRACPALSLLIANFPKSLAGKPALLTLSDVSTFFHELGHAMHSILGATRLYSCAGTGVKFDFVETPSQMFEQWMSDRSMLKRVSGHYESGKPLPEKILDALEKSRFFGRGLFAKTQALYSQLALAYFAPGEDKDVHGLKNEFFASLSDYCTVSEDDYFECSWGHLSGYGPRYYSYLWSLVYALDIFEDIKKAGLHSRVVGDRVRKKVLEPGGSLHAARLLEDFLGREPNNKAFLKYLGL